MADEFLAVAKVAGLLKLNQRTVRNMVDRVICPVRVGTRRVRILRSDLDEFLTEGRRAPIASQ